MDNRLTPPDTTENPDASNPTPQQPAFDPNANPSGVQTQPLPPQQPAFAAQPDTAQPTPPQAAVVPQPAPEQPLPPVEPTAPIQQEQSTPVNLPGAYAPAAMLNPQVIRQPSEAYYKEAAEQKAHYMKKVLDGQPKILTMIPLFPGEKDGTMHYIGINGYSLWIRKGVFVAVPQQVAELIAESFNLTYDAGREFEVESSEAKKSALL